jgi:pyridoxine kinase
MARVLSISSQVLWGPVGNSAIVPALQSLGHEVIAVPTVILSNHPGHGKPDGFAISPDQFSSWFTQLEKLGALKNCDAILTGYLASPEQIKIASNIIRTISPKHVLIDPVIGDHGKLYVAESIAEAIRDLLIPQATITTPNLFELGWLTSSHIQTHNDAATAARKLATSEVLVTSVHANPSEIETLLVLKNTELVSASPERSDVPNGTGDFLAGLYLAHRLTKNPDTAFHSAMSGLNEVISRSTGSKVLRIAESLHSSPTPTA